MTTILGDWERKVLVADSQFSDTSTGIKYFEDKVFIRILKRFLKNIKSGGELVIGNFHPKNPSKDYMEFGFWYLNYRTEEDLIRLANSCGIENRYIAINRESEGVNLFLHIKKENYSCP